MATGVPLRGFEASAPCALRLHARVAVALDRRATCRAEPGGEALEVESKEALLRLRVGSPEELRASAVLGWLAPLLAACEVGGGARLVLQARVPETTGLGVRASLAVAVAAAALTLRGKPPDPDGLGGRVVAALPGLPAADVWAAVRGGIVSVAEGKPGRRELLDPAPVEERLLLLDVGVAPAEPGDAEPGLQPYDAGALLKALREGTPRDVPRLLRPQAPPAPESAAAVAAKAEALGGQAWLLRATSGLLAVWIEPDRRAALLEHARAHGLRPVACRLDLLGCEVEPSPTASAGSGGGARL
jgi:hypothetical protein